MKKRNINITLNIMIVILEIIGLIHNYKYNNRLAIEYYTEESNILALISSLLYVIYIIKNGSIPKWLSNFKYMTTVNLSITFFVVLFILTPMFDFNFKGMFLEGTLLYHHLLCPLMGIITFLFFDELLIFNNKDILFSLIYTFGYAVVTVLLNYFDKLIGPYPFLMVKSQSMFLSLMWMIIIFSLAYVISYLLKLAYNKRCSK